VPLTNRKILKAGMVRTYSANPGSSFPREDYSKKKKKKKKVVFGEEQF